MLPVAFEALIDDLAHCILEIRNGNIILMNVSVLTRAVSFLFADRPTIFVSYELS